MNIKNKSVRRRTRKYTEQVERWSDGTMNVELAVSRLQAYNERSAQRDAMKRGLRTLIGLQESVPSMQARTGWRAAIKKVLGR